MPWPSVETTLMKYSQPRCKQCSKHRPLTDGFRRVFQRGGCAILRVSALLKQKAFGPLLNALAKCRNDSDEVQSATLQTVLEASTPYGRFPTGFSARRLRYPQSLCTIETEGIRTSSECPGQVS